MAGLTPKQQAFVEQYLIDRNGTQAAVRAGYSAKTANEQAARLLANASVAEAVAKGCEKAAKRAGTQADWVRRKLKRVVELGLRVEQTKCGDLEEQSVSTLNLAAVNKALELLGKDDGMFTDKLEMSGPNGAPLSLTVAFVRAKA